MISPVAVRAAPAPLPPETVVDAVERIEPIATGWDELADRVRAAPFLRPGWIAAWWSAFGAGRLEILVARRGDRIVGVLPLSRSPGVLTSTSNAHTPEFGILAEDRQSARRLAEALFARAERKVSLARLDPGAVGTADCRLAAAAAGRRQVLVTQQRSPYLALAGGDHAARKRLGRKVYAELRRRRRRLEELGAVTIDLHDGRDRLESLLDEGFCIEGSGWKVARGTAILSRECTRRHYAEVARWAGRRGSLVLAFLRLDGLPIAFQFALQEGGRYYFLKGGYATEYARLAPGKLLVQATVERAIAQGLECYEFLGAAEPWKLEWTDTVRERVRIDSFAASPVGLVDWAASALALHGRSLAKRVLVGVR